MKGRAECRDDFRPIIEPANKEARWRVGMEGGGRVERVSEITAKGTRNLENKFGIVGSHKRGRGWKWDGSHEENRRIWRGSDKGASGEAFQERKCSLQDVWYVI